MKKLFFRILLPVFVVVLSGYKTPVFIDREFYELRLYYFENKTQETRLDQYLQTALLPALHRLKIKKIGVFKPIANDTSATQKIIVLIPFKKMEQFLEMEEKLGKDKEYQATGEDYINSVYTNPPYKRMETILLKAFSEMPVSQIPALKSASSERVYELRSYEGATEKIYKNKVSMFNEGGEVDLFKRLGFNAVFYGEVLAGSQMPNLMYMTSFENMDDRNAHWKAFSADPEWKKLSGMPQYQKNVSKSEVFLLRGTAYSDL